MLRQGETLLALSRMAEAYNASGHSIFGPSSSAMWLYCKGSLIANLMNPGGGSYEAAEGTVAHGIAEEWLKTGKKPRHRVGTTERITEKDRSGKTVHYDVLITWTMLDYVQEYVDWCQMLPGDHFTETKVFFSEYMPIPNQGGTADHAACEPGILTVTDLKYGKGVEVSVTDNSQALLYALGFFLKYDHIYDFHTIRIRICQPRMGNWGEWEVTREQLLDFGETVRQSAKEAWQIDAPRRPSEKSCQWCNVKGKCVAVLMMIDALIGGRVEDLGREYDKDEMEAYAAYIMSKKYRIERVAMVDLTLEHLAKIRPFKRLADSFFKTVDETAEALALGGKNIPGHKLVEGRTYRQFKSEKDAIELFELIGLPKSDYLKSELISPAESEELIRERLPALRKCDVEALVKTITVKPPGRPTLAPLSDRRPEYDDGADSILTDDDDEI